MKPEEGFNEMDNHEKLNQIGALLDAIIGVPKFRERKEALGEQF